MDDNKIEMSSWEYDQGIRLNERIATVERMVKSGQYVSAECILTILGIDIPEKKGE